MMVLISETVAGLKYFSLDFDEASIVSNGGGHVSTGFRRSGQNVAIKDLSRKQAIDKFCPFQNFSLIFPSASFPIARFRDRSLIATFCPIRRKPVDTVDWQVAKKISSLSFYTKMSRRWLISSLKLKGLYRWDFLIINTELKRKDGIFMYSRSLEDRNAEVFVS